MDAPPVLFYILELYMQNDFGVNLEILVSLPCETPSFLQVDSSTLGTSVACIRSMYYETVIWW